MITEQEILEQLLDESWQLQRAVEFINAAGKDGWSVVLRHWEQGNIEAHSASGDPLPEWQIREVIRERNAVANVFLTCTRQGGRLV